MKTLTLTCKNLQKEIIKLRLAAKKDKNKERGLGVDNALFVIQLKFNLFEP